MAQNLTERGRYNAELDDKNSPNFRKEASVRVCGAKMWYNTVQFVLKGV